MIVLNSKIFVPFFIKLGKRQGGQLKSPLFNQLSCTIASEISKKMSYKSLHICR